MLISHFKLSHTKNQCMLYQSENLLFLHLTPPKPNTALIKFVNVLMRRFDTRNMLCHLDHIKYPNTNQTFACFFL
ncbi:hypothetical protein HanRHA438_Chr09g0379081 [Helianthus annuus]|nr:hypothetical protein HanHA89_Chr09g0322301 [Helianthus annuus]KAJ0706006.1 hypothetical protein HanLR1_Chr09g0301991 [Helianthus annuus]KAJ0886409.1 hypothetical protein HanRHA438_Chr09g0379081 [Helianthus annuus]